MILRLRDPRAPEILPSWRTFDVKINLKNGAIYVKILHNFTVKNKIEMESNVLKPILGANRAQTAIVVVYSQKTNRVKKSTGRVPDKSVEIRRAL